MITNPLEASFKALNAETFTVLVDGEEVFLVQNEHFVDLEEIIAGAKRAVMTHHLDPGREISTHYLNLDKDQLHFYTKVRRNM